MCEFGAITNIGNVPIKVVSLSEWGVALERPPKNKPIHVPGEKVAYSGFVCF